MMKYLKYFAIAFLLAVATIVIGTYIFLGAYKEPKYMSAILPQLHIVYTEYQGPYHEISKSIQKVEDWAKKNKHICAKSFGIYFDDPKQIAPMDLRSWGGCIIDHEISEELPNNLKNLKLVPTNVLKALFKGSPSIGPMKVYPYAKNWYKNQSKEMGPTMEVYQTIDNNLQTTYYFSEKSYYEKLKPSAANN